MNNPKVPHSEQVIAAMKAWVERAVIGLNLCPFAKAVQTKNAIRYVVSDAATPDELASDLAGELQRLHSADQNQLATTLLIHPFVLTDFLDYNDFLETADAIVRAMQLEGILQVASFHPDYQFAHTAPDDITNYTNRSPYPSLHLLREASIDEAVKAFPDASAIFERNMDTLRKLGHAGWQETIEQVPSPVPHKKID